MTAVEPPAPSRARSPYFVGPWTDVLVIGGLSIAVFAAIRAWAPAQRSAPLGHLAAWLVWIVNWPHFSATSYRLYRSRANVAQYPVTAFAVPLLVAAGIFASLSDVRVVAPAFVKLFLLWSPYHFSGQTIGISLLYARRAGLKVGAVERVSLMAFVFGSFLAPSLAAETWGASQPYHGIEVPSFGLPGWPGVVASVVMYAGGAVLLGSYVRGCLRDGRLHPPIVLLPAIAQFVWFVPGGFLPDYAQFVPLFHSLQYLLIAWALQLKERLDESGAAPSRRFVLSESLAWGAVNLAGGAALFWALPRLAVAEGVPLSIAEPVFIAGIQIHHFFVDGVIWKLRNPKVSSPLRVNLGDLAGGAAPEPPQRAPA